MLDKSGGVGHPTPVYHGRDKVRIRWEPLDYYLLAIVMCILDGLDESVVFPLNFFRM